MVIALACRSLPKHLQNWGLVLGTIPAVVLRIVFAIVIAFLMALPLLKLIGGAALFWIAINMLGSDESGEGEEREGASTIWAAMRTIIIADAVMSLDNVIAIAAAARGDMTLLVIGLLISMPLVICGAALLLKLLTRFPILVVGGAALLGWIAGELVVSDPWLVTWIDEKAGFLHLGAPIAGAVIVVVVGQVLSRRRAAQQP